MDIPNEPTQSMKKSFVAEGWDSNPRPPVYETGELPTAPPRDVKKYFPILTNRKAQKC